MVRQTVQNGHITKNGVLPATTLLFRKFCFSLRTLDKEWIWCTNQQNDNWWFIIFENLFLCESTFSLSLLLQMTIVFQAWLAHPNVQFSNKVWREWKIGLKWAQFSILFILCLRSKRVSSCSQYSGKIYISRKLENCLCCVTK